MTVIEEAIRQESTRDGLVLTQSLQAIVLPPGLRPLSPKQANSLIGRLGVDF